MHIDDFTILVGACAAVFLAGGAFIFFWLQDRRAKWLAWWVAPFMLGTGGIAGFIGRGLLDDWISIGLANALLFAAFHFAWQGMRVFVGKPARFWPSLIVPALWLLICAVPGFMDSIALRVIIASALIAGYSLLTARELWRQDQEALPSRAAAIVTLISFSVFIGLRAPFVGYLPFPMGAQPMSSLWLAMFNLVVLAHVGAFAMLMVSLTKERREAEQRTFAMIDPLTGLMNRRAFMAAVERATRRGRREPMTLLVLDLDHFKQINDRFGHEIGDRVLYGFAQVAERVTRPNDQLYRMGGEEFCFLLPDCGLSEALAVAERIRTAFAALAIDARGIEAKTTVSIGLADDGGSQIDLEVLLEAADAALYEAKARGRNQVVLSSPSLLRPVAPKARQEDRRSA